MIVLLNTLMGLPPVVVGLFVWLCGRLFLIGRRAEERGLGFAAYVSYGIAVWLSYRDLWAMPDAWQRPLAIAGCGITVVVPETSAGSTSGSGAGTTTGGRRPAIASAAEAAQRRAGRVNPDTVGEETRLMTRAAPWWWQSALPGAT